jgi:hypothetical protein
MNEMTQPSKPSKTGSKKPTGEAKTQTKPKAEGKILPVTDPIDLWYLCEKARYAKQHPYRRAGDGRPMYQRVVAQHIRRDNEFFKYRFPYCAEVGFDMSQTPPAPLMSRNDPTRPTTYPLSYYELIRNKFLPNSITVRVSTDLLSKDELEQLIALPIPDKNKGIYTDEKGGVRGLLRIPDVLRLYSFNNPGTAQYSQKNLVSVIEMKFPGDKLSDKQKNAYLSIAGDFNKLRLLHTENCEDPEKRKKLRRDWMKAAQREPVYKPVNTALERASVRALRTPYALLVESIDEEQREVRRQFEIKPPPPGTPIMTAGPSRQELQRREEERRRARAGLEMVLGGPLFVTAATPIVISTGAPTAVTGVVTAGARVGAPAVAAVKTITANVGGVVIRHWRYTLPIAANAAVFEAAAEEVPPPDRDSKLTPKENNFWDEYQAWAWGEDAINLTESVRHYLFWMDLLE